jgi:hypothetical protein
MPLSKEAEGAIMNRMRVILTSTLVFFGAAISAPALAAGGWQGGGTWHGGGAWHGGCCWRGGVFIGGLGWGPWYYPPYHGYSPYYEYPYYYPPAVAVPAGPTQYIDQGGAAQAPAQQGSWYYCAGSKTYYPYVKECPGGWQRVAPQPPDG